MPMYNPYDYNLNRQGSYSYNNPASIQNYGATLQNNMAQQNMLSNQGVTYFECRPVTSIEEARAATVKWDGSPVVLIDRANKKHYEKRLNPDGTATFETYSLVLDEPKNVQMSAPNEQNEYIKQLEDKILVLTSQNNQILEKLESYKDLFFQKEVVLNDANTKSDADVAVVEGTKRANANASTNGRK